MVRILLPTVVLCVVLCLVLWRHLGLPLCVGVVSGSSMEPTIPPGSVVVGVRGEPRVGSVVVFDRGGRLVVHRVVHANSTHVVTRGDACVEDDPPTPVEDVLCVVVFHVRSEAVALAAVATIGAWYLAKNLRKRG